jgi:hypothetical protein
LIKITARRPLARHGFCEILLLASSWARKSASLAPHHG